MFTKKRAFDLLSSILIISVITPFVIFAYPLLIWLIGKPIFFRQLRTGKNDRPFTMYKLRSMKKNAQESKKRYIGENEAPAPMFKIFNDPRFIKKAIKLPGSKKTKVLAVGQFLSKSGLDEIPQLLNILKGEMSLIGPRPLPVNEAEAIKRTDPSWYKWRHSVNPGIFSAWAADPEHNLSLKHWKKLEKETLELTSYKQIAIILKICFKQASNLLTNNKD